MTRSTTVEHLDGHDNPTSRLESPRSDSHLSGLYVG